MLPFGKEPVLGVKVAPKKGVIALMGSGELTSTMVEVHKELLRMQGDLPRAVFLDTPAGFQLNVDQLSQRAAAYFRAHVGREMEIASFKSSETSTPYEAEQAFHALREADFILIGPGSPTYAVRQWMRSPIPEILIRRVEAGGCLVAASAAALTIGRFALPVYEIYKVGEEVHWVDGMDILGHLGLPLVVVPHWNNAEGGTHDTRFCYMGEPRFRRLEALLPEDVSVLGLDEHTACLIDLARDEALIKGIGRVTLRRKGEERVFSRGTRISLEALRGGSAGAEVALRTQTQGAPGSTSGKKAASFWEAVHAIEASFQEGLERDEPQEATHALLELDRTIWEAHQDLESQEFISQAREIMREMIVLLGLKVGSSPGHRTKIAFSLVEALLQHREGFRQKGQWQEADAIRDIVERSGIIIEDTPEGPKWRLKQ